MNHYAIVPNKATMPHSDIESIGPLAATGPHRANDTREVIGPYGSSFMC